MAENKQRYRVTRIYGIAGKNRPKRVMKKYIRCRYLAKSKVIRCDFSNAQIAHVNFRGSVLKQCNFKNAQIFGVDFWGTNLNGSDFSRATLRRVIFVAAKIDKCKFNQTIFEDVIFVNTNISNSKNLNIGQQGIEVFNKYPKNVMPLELWEAIDDLKLNKHFYKTKVLHLPGNRYNEFNIMLLLQRFGMEELLRVLRIAKTAVKKDMVTYSYMEKELHKLLTL